MPPVTAIANRSKDLGTSTGTIVLALALIVCSACAPVIEPSPTPKPSSPTRTEPAVPRAEPLSKYGNPVSYEVHGKRYYTLKTASGFSERGIASWYGGKFHGRRTSSGETYDMYRMTAAHKQLPLPTYVSVRNLENNRTAVVRVNDRGPFHDNRIIDLSYAAALKLGIVENGTGFVEITAINPQSKPSQQQTQMAQKAANNGFYLQVGAFSEVANAENMARRLEPLLPGKIVVRKRNDNGRLLHRVQVGPVRAVEAADSIVALLNKAGIFEHHFVVP